VKRIAIFVVLTAVFSAPFCWLHASTGYGPYIVLLMWCHGTHGIQVSRSASTTLRILLLETQT
jgi:hypothetical protein